MAPPSPAWSLSAAVELRHERSRGRRAQDVSDGEETTRGDPDLTSGRRCGGSWEGVRCRGLYSLAATPCSYRYGVIVELIDVCIKLVHAACRVGMMPYDDSMMAVRP